MPILDQWGNPITSKPPENKVLGGALGLDNRFRNYPSRGLTPQKLARIIQEADEGDLQLQTELFEDIEERDGHTFSQFQTRKLAVAGLEWRIEPANETPEAKKYADAFRTMWENLETESLFLELLDAIAKGVSLVNVAWERTAGEWIPSQFEHISGHHLLYNYPQKRFLIRSLEHPMGEALPFGATIEHRYRARTGSPTRAGVMRTVAAFYLFKHYSIKDWVIFAELFGQPYRLGKYDPATGPEEKNALEMAVRALGADAAGIISKDTEIEIIQIANRGGPDVYSQLREICNEEISLAVLGQTLTSSVGKVGSQALGNVHNKVRLDIREYDAKSIARTLRRDLARAFIAFNYGADKADLAPNLNPMIEEQEDLLQVSEIAKNLHEIGFEIPVSWVTEKFGIPTAQGNEPTLKKAAPNTQAALEYAVLENGARALPKGVMNGQNFVSSLIDHAANAAEYAIKPALNRVLEIIDSSDGFDDLRHKLIDAFPDLDVFEIANLLETANILGNLAGRYAMLEDAK